jgi:hypothetical protein
MGRPQRPANNPGGVKIVNNEWGKHAQTSIFPLQETLIEQ